MIEEENLIQPGTGPGPTYSDSDRKTSRRRWWRYGPPIVWAILIFIGSSDLLSGSHTGGVLLGPLRWLFPHASEATLGAHPFLDPQSRTPD